MAYRFEADLERHYPRETAKWALGLALFLSTTAALFALQLFQVSGEGTARPALERAIDALAEGDAIIERHHDSLQASAEASQSGELIALDDYPVQVTFTRDEILGAGVPEIHALALERATDRVYEEGGGAIRDDEATGAPGRFSSAGAIDEFLGLLTDDTRRITTYAAFGLVALSAVLALLLALACRGYGRIGAPGVALLGAAAMLLAAGGLAWISANTSSRDEYVRGELMAVAEELATLPLRNGAALAALGGVMVAVALVGSRLAGRASHARSRGVS